ncbi:hypothetical protein [Kribbella deserti]|uniref:DUF4352 domain-containing protein n=1 Tax=Kribbella deserti TaxID=1926257 RepID=A0ABV6QHP2_9ACTN
MKPAVRRTLAATTILLIAAGGWYVVPRHDGGPLADAGARLCVPVGGATYVTLTSSRVQNTGSARVVITDVSLIGADPEDVEYGGAFLDPKGNPGPNVRPGRTYGNGPWDEPDGPRQAVGAEVSPATSEQPGPVLGIHLKRLDVLGESRVRGIRVEYWSGARRFAREYDLEYTLRPGPCH